MGNGAGMRGTFGGSIVHGSDCDRLVRQGIPRGESQAIGTHRGLSVGHDGNSHVIGRHRVKFNLVTPRCTTFRNTDASRRNGDSCNVIVSDCDSHTTWSNCAVLGIGTRNGMSDSARMSGTLIYAIIRRRNGDRLGC